MPTGLLEVPVDSLSDALLAATHADRLELCNDLVNEGWSPPAGLVKAVRGECGARVVAMIRPRLPESLNAATAESFTASRRVIDASRREIESLARAGVHGVAIGLVHPGGSIDIEACQELVACAQEANLEVAFHRAFDLAPNRDRAMRDICELGVARVLTAGVLGWNAAVKSIDDRIATLAEDSRLAGDYSHPTSQAPIVMPGGGVRASNAAKFLGVSPELHSSCRREGKLDREELTQIASVIHGCLR